MRAHVYEQHGQVHTSEEVVLVRGPQRALVGSSLAIDEWFPQLPKRTSASGDFAGGWWHVYDHLRPGEDLFDALARVRGTGIGMEDWHIKRVAGGLFDLHFHAASCHIYTALLWHRAAVSARRDAKFQAFLSSAICSPEQSAPNGGGDA
jgi:hypothetical protein